MGQKVLVLYARENQGKDGRWFRDVQYFEVQEPENTPQQKGVKALTVGGTEEGMKSIMSSSLPAVFDVEFGNRADFRGEAKSVVLSAKLLKAVKVADVGHAAS